ncbi:BamA/TamA family outer membrane protein [Agarivorans sp. 1_MG-2023]|uniref:BamA/TamA family outer membrane protein n=1 Tax=Agarivorans sp. 1_MG-2023 TaxID=3062634 RepID=UPI0026E1C52E|nr:BamA/TamA family outer membrane protein [Agarivorans sp. 1_MG-2023]MDO6762150.1 BamA/TamA family outer membrane protein [Agarivorans sp. 1_MG-2023]
MKTTWAAMALSALSISIYSTVSTASYFDEVDGQFDLGHHLAENAYGFLPIPILITEPAVGGGGGAMGLFLHETEEEKIARKKLAMSSLDGGAQLIPSAITLVGAAGTENGTWFAFAGHRHSWMKDSIRYTGGVGLGKANLNIYKDLSLGDFTKSMQMGTKTEGALALQKLQFRIADTPLMLGAKQVVGVSKVTIDTGNSNADKLLNGLLGLVWGDESITSGLGFIAEYDTRDNIFYPTRGYKLNADYMIYDKKLGSDWDYQNLNVDGEVYLPLGRKWNLAFAGNYQLFSSDELFLSPTARPYVGLRGVSAYRYQGDEIHTIQSQLTYSIDHRWTISAFYGAGQAIQESKLATNESVQSVGAGFRYQIARRYGLRLGMDFAYSGEESAVYFQVGSGF